MTITGDLLTLWGLAEILQTYFKDKCSSHKHAALCILVILSTDKIVRST